MAISQVAGMPWAIALVGHLEGRHNACDASVEVHKGPRLGLTIPSSRSRFAARLGPGVRPMPRFLVATTLLLLGFGAHAQEGPSVQKLTKQQLAACKAKGGRPEMVLYYVEGCVWPTQDAGKVCRDAADCQGFCEAPFGTEVGARTVGKCSKEGADRAGGCTNLVEHGRSTGDVCVH
jgi:hypothetical protein